MLLRFLLVSVVTSMGMDAPSETQMDCWTCQARSWWDAHALSQAGTEEIAPPPAPSIVAAPESATIPATEPTATLVATEPVTPMPDGTTAFADEVVTPTPDAMALLAAELSSQIPPESVVDAPSPMPDSSDAFVEETVDLMPQGLAAFVSEPTTLEVLVTPAEEPAEPAPDLTSDDLTSDSAIAALLAELTADSATSFYPGLAFETSEVKTPEEKPESQIEILDEQPEPPALAAPAPAKDQKLTEAVRLTQQALRAWVGVLNAPAVVSVIR